MKRKIFSKLLMGAFLIASVSMFMSCKDYDDDISANTAEIEALKAKLNSDISGVKSDLTAQLATVNAQIDQLKAQIADKASKSDLTAGLATKADADALTSLEARVATLEAQIKALDEIKSDLAKKADASALAGKADASAVEALKTSIEGQLAAITGDMSKFIDEAKAKAIAEAALKTLDIQGEALKVFQNNITAALSPYLKAEDLDGELAKKGYLTQKDLATLTTNVEELQKLMTADYKAKIDALLETKFLTADDIKGKLDKTDFDKTIEDLTKQFEDINKSITDVNADLSAINIFVNKKLTAIVLKPNFYWEGIEGIEAPFIYQTPIFEEKGNYTFKYNLTNAPAGSPAIDVWVEKSMGWKGFGDKRELAKYVIAAPKAAHYNYPDIASTTPDLNGFYKYNMGTANNKKVNKIDIAYGAVAKYHLNPTIADITKEGTKIGFFENDAPVYTRAAGLSIDPKVLTDKDGNYAVTNTAGLLTVPFEVNYINVIKYFVDWTNSQTLNWEGRAGASKESWSTLWYETTTGAVYGSDDSDAAGSCSDAVFGENLPFVSLKIDIPADTEKNQDAYTVSSDYALVVPALYEIVALADKAPETGLDLGTFVKTPNHEIRDNHLYETVGYNDSGITAEDAVLANKKFHDVKAYGAIPMPATHSVVYNGSIDLLDYVETHFNYRTFAQYGKSQFDAVLDTWDGGQLMKNLGLEYRFTVINYKVGAETTSESAHIQQSDGKGVGSLFTPRSVTAEGETIKDLPATREVIDREPLVRVDLINTKGNNEIIRYGYIKLRIVDAAAVNKDKFVEIPMPEVWMNCGDEAKITWSQVENLILAQLGEAGYTKQEFERNYKLDVEGGYNFMPYLDPTKITGDTDPAGALYTPSWTAKRYVIKNGTPVAAKDETDLNNWSNVDNHFGEVWYTPHDNSTEGHNWDEQTNVLIWNFYPGTFAGARATLAAPVAKAQAGNMDNAKYQKLMAVTGVDYDTKGTSQKFVSTVVRFINKQNNTSIWVTLKVDAQKLHFEYGNVGNKNWSHWFEFNSAKGGVETNNKPYWTEFDTRINPFKPSNVNYRFLDVTDFNQMLTDHWMNPGQMIKFEGDPAKFSNFAAGSNVTFEFTYPVPGLNSQSLGTSNDAKYGKVWKIKGVSGTTWTLAIGAHAAAPGAAWAAGADALWVVKKGGATYEEEVAYLDGTIAGVANNVKIHYHGLENAGTPNLYPAATDLVNLMGAYDKNGDPRFSTTSNELTNLTKAYFLEDNENRAFTAYIKISVTHWCYDPLISKQYFNVRFHRPINVVGKEYNWNDRNLNDNYINIKDLVEIVDWNRFPVVPYNNAAVAAKNTMFNMDFPSYADVYASNKVKQQNKGIPYEFYGIQELAIRYGEIRSDMPKPMSVRNNLAGTLANLDANSVKIGDIPALVSPREAPAGYKTVTLLNANGSIAGWGANDYNQSNYNAAAPGNTSYGRIYFNNDGSDTQLFHIFVPIAV